MLVRGGSGKWWKRFFEGGSDLVAWLLLVALLGNGLELDTYESGINMGHLSVFIF